MSGNPVVARLASNNFLTDQGTSAQLIFRFSADEANGRTFIFSSELAGTFTFTFRNNPDLNSPSDLRLKGQLSDLVWISLLKTVFESNFLLSEHYFVTEDVFAGNSVIKLVAKQPGIESTIQIGEGTVQNLVVIQNTPGSSRLIRPNFRVLVEIYMKGLVNFRRKGFGELISVDSQGIGIAEINAYLEERIENQFSWPIQGLTPIAFRNQMSARTYIRYGESYGLPEQVYRLFKSPEFVTLQGRIPRKRLPDFLRKYHDLRDYFFKEKRFLSWQPIVKETYIDAPEKLFWFHFYENVDQAKIRLKRVFQDGTSTTIDFTSVFSTGAFQVLEIETSASILAQGISNIAELHVWLAKGDNTPISATQVYIFKPRPAEVHYYLFQNSFGAYDTAAFTGDLIEEDEYTRELEETYKPSSYSQIQRRFRNFQVDQLERFTVYSGYSTDKEWLLWLDDLFTSPSVFEVVKNVLHEVTIENAKVFKSRTTEFVRSLSFNYFRQSPENIYRVAPPSIIALQPIVDDELPIPQFPAQMVQGDSGIDELYFPGNAWIQIPNTMESLNAFALTAVVYLLDGNVVLFSDENLTIAVHATGSKIVVIEHQEIDNQYELELGQDLRRRQFLIQIQVSSGQLSVLINGNLTGVLEEEITASFAPTHFGRKYGVFGNFKGRLGDYHFGPASDINNVEVFLAMAERFGLPVPGVNWLLQYDEETRDFIITNGLTRSGVISGSVQLGRAEMPMFDIIPGAYVGPYPVKLVSKNPGGVLHFTVDGSEPTTLSPIFNPLTDEIEVNSAMSIRMIEVVDGLLPSQIVTGNFTLQPALAPVIIPNGGEFTSPKFIEFFSATPGVTYYYTLNGNEPTLNSPVFDPDNLPALTAPSDTIANITVKVIAAGAGYGPSPVTEANFEISGFTYGFMLEFTVSGTEAGRTVTLPFTNGGTYNAFIDWGDGTDISHVTAFNSTARIHTYAINGTYVIKITGSAPGFSFNNAGDRLKLTRIVHWGDADKFGGFNNLNGAFWGCSNCTSLGIGKIRSIVPSLNLTSAFRSTGISTIPEGIFDELQNITVGSTFRGCTALVNIPSDLFRFSTGITSFPNTFDGCTSLVEIPTDLFRYNTAVTGGNSFAATFTGCTSLQVIPVDLFRYNVQASSFSSCFRNCSNLKILPIDIFKYNVNAGSSAFLTTFENCGLETLPPELFRYNANVTGSSFQRTFANCPKLTLRSDLFFNAGEQSTRFLNRSISFQECFLRSSFTGVQGTAPDLWNCDFGTGVVTRSGAFFGAGNSGTSLTNFANIPSNWINY